LLYLPITAGRNLNLITGVTAGFASPLKALVLDSNRDIININSLTSSNLYSNSLTLNGTAITATSNEINTLSGVIAGTVSASKALIVDSNKDLSSLRNLTLSGSLTANTLTGTIQTSNQPNITSIGVLTSLSVNNLTLNGIAVSATASELNYLSGVIAGTASASKALILDSSRNVSNINNLTSTGTINAQSFTVNGVSITSSSITYLDIATLGIAESSKALILNSSRNISNINNLTTSGYIDANTLKIDGTTITSSASEINKLDGYTGNTFELNYLSGASTGVATSLKVMVPNLYNNIEGINSFICTSLTASHIYGTLQTASQPNITSLGTLTSLNTNSLSINSVLITATASEINYNDITTIGIAEESKALILDSLRNITNISSLSATTLTGTLQTASQPNITSLGTLTSLTVNSSNTNILKLLTSNATVLTHSSLAEDFNISLRNTTLTAGNTVGIAFSITNNFTSESGASIIADRVSVTSCNLSFATSQVERLRISSTGLITMPNNTSSTTSTTGALVITGGLGVGDNVNISGYSKSAQILVGTSTDTTSTRLISALDNNMADNTVKSICFGKVNSLRNQAELSYTHVSNGSANNLLRFGFFGNSSILSVRADSRVGILNTSPAYALDVIGIIKASARLLIGTSTESSSLKLLSALDNTMPNETTRILEYGRDTFNNNSVQLLYTYVSNLSTSNSFGIAFAGSGEKFTLLANGNIGISNTAPAYTLDVNGSLNATSFNLGGTALTASAAEFNALDLSVAFGFAEASKALIVDANRDISNIRNLSVTTNLTTTTNAGIGFSHSGGSAGSMRMVSFINSTTNSTTGFFGMNTNHDLSLMTNNISRLRISAAGNVGINTSSLNNARFNIVHSGNQFRAGDGTGIFQIYCDTADVFGRQFLVGTTSNDALTFITNNNIRGTFQANGYFSIGNGDALYPLHVLFNRATGAGTLTYRWYRNDGQNGQSTANPSNVSAKFEGRIVINDEIDIVSDRRTKHDINLLDKDFCRNFVKSINPKRFKYNQDPNGVHYGYIAQDLIKQNYTDFIMVEDNKDMIEDIDEDGFISEQGLVYTLSKNQIIPVLHNCIKDLYEQIESLKAIIYNGSRRKSKSI
jgi:hypothetical protein